MLETDFIFTFHQVTFYVKRGQRMHRCPRHLSEVFHTYWTSTRDL